MIRGSGQEPGDHPLLNKIVQQSRNIHKSRRRFFILSDRYFLSLGLSLPIHFKVNQIDTPRIRMSEMEKKDEKGVDCSVYGSKYYYYY